MRANKKHVLVIDPESAVRDAVRRYLEGAGDLEVDEGRDGLDVVARLLLKPYALIVAASQLPNMNGMEIVKFVA